MPVLFIILIATLALVLLARWMYRRTTPDAPPPAAEVDSGCCGAHAVCEKETLLNSSNKPVYYDDEELDALAGIAPDDYTDAQAAMLADVFYIKGKRRGRMVAQPANTPHRVTRRTARRSPCSSCANGGDCEEAGA